jgi:hypothetical protein
MVEQGLVMLIQAGLGSPPVILGGFSDMLPKDTISQTTPMAWVYHSISSDPSFKWSGQSSWTDWYVQIDCHGYAADDALSLMRMIDNILRGPFHGRLPDPDATLVHGIWREAPNISGYSDANRTYVRSLEYKVQYLQI